MLHHAAALRNERRMARLQLVIATTAAAGGEAVTKLHGKLED